MMKQKRPTHYRYEPVPGFMVMGLRPGATVKVKNEEHRAQLDANRCFVPVEPEAADEDGDQTGRAGGE